MIFFILANRPYDDQIYNPNSSEPKARIWGSEKNHFFSSSFFFYQEQKKKKKVGLEKKS
jgi:hypothetical protein